MIRVCIVCEGQTEIEFVRACLAPYLHNHGINAFPSLLQSPNGQHRGGNVTVERLVGFISHQYHETDRITTLVDFYGFRNRDGRNREQLEQAIQTGVANKTTRYNARFVLPYVQMYEFEGLLFSDIEQFQTILDGWNDTVRTALHTIRRAFRTPENINDGQETAPSKRISSIFKGTYSKTEHGPLIAEKIGIDRIREQCPQFNEWIERLLAWRDPL